MGVAANIGKIAKEKGITLKELSRLADVPYTTLYNAVKRDSKMELGTVQRIAAALQVFWLDLYPEEHMKYLTGYEYVYAKIDELLGQKNMSRRQLAKEIGVAPSTLQSAFEAKSKLSIERLKKILAVLDARYEDIYPSNLLGEAIKYNLFTGMIDGEQSASFVPNDPNMKRIENAFSMLNSDGQAVAAERVEELAQIPKYQNDSTESAQNAPDASNDISPNEK